MTSLRSLKKLALASGTAAALAWSFNAHALPSVTTAFVNGQQQWSDDSGEILLDNDGDGFVSPGDYFVGVFGITSFPTSGVAANTVSQWTGIFATQVLTAASVPAAACGNAVATSCGVFDFGTVTSGPNPAADFNAALAATGLASMAGAAFTNPDGSALSADTLVLWFEGPPDDFVRDLPSTINDAFAQASNGTLRLVFGLVGANGDSFSAVAPQNLADFGTCLATPTCGSGAGLGSFSVNGTVLANGFPNITFDPNFTANGSIKPTATSNFVVTDDTTFEVFLTTVPEIDAVAGTGALTLLGGALVLMGERRRRRG